MPANLRFFRLVSALEGGGVGWAVRPFSIASCIDACHLNCTLSWRLLWAVCTPNHPAWWRQAVGLN